MRSQNLRLKIMSFPSYKTASAEPSDDRVGELGFGQPGSSYAAAMRKDAARQLIDILAAMPALIRDHSKPADFLLALCDQIHLQVPEIRVSAWAVTGVNPPEMAALHPQNGNANDPAPERPGPNVVKKVINSLAQGCWVSQWQREQRHKTAETLFSDRPEWAMCVPVLLSERERFLLYATGARNRDRTELRELQQVLAALGSIAKQHLATARVRERQGQIGQFFSPLLRSVLTSEAGESTELLKPGEFEVTICFFDLRGFSRETENARQTLSDAGGVLRHFGRLERILGEAANVIFEAGGIIIDFQGDAILACWGIPLPGAPSSPIRQAITAARRIIEMMESHDWPRDASNLRCGIGMTHGRVLAGLFSAQHDGQPLLSKYTVIGAPVNQAARLEAVTKKFGVPVLIDGEVAKNLPSEDALIRRIARVRPAGMNLVVELFELVLPKEVGGTSITAAGVAAYQHALELFERGDFEGAAEAMREVPRDQIELFLSEQITAMRCYGAPVNWDGVINLTSK